MWHRSDWLGRTVIVLGIALLLNACAVERFGPSAPGKTKAPPRTLKQLTVAERASILRRAQVWAPIDTPSLNLLSGPPGTGAAQLDETVSCRFVYPERPLSGQTQKFRCALGPEDVVKVKYGQRNGEIYAAVAASRLVWALGFATDRWYPVRVTCVDCPKDPWLISKLEWFKGRPRFIAARTFEMAAVERVYDGEEIETPGHAGWAWPELDHVDARAGGASRTHVDALRLLAVFLQHNDTKTAQQKLVCAPRSIGRDEAGNHTCRSPWLVLKDLGATFSEGSFWSVSKMKLQRWQDAPIWRDGERCVGHLQRFLNGSLDDPVIGEAGRAFLARRLSLLSDAQLRDLFTAARVERRDETIRTGEGSERPATIDDWVRVFKDKRTEIVNHRCPA